MTRVEWINKMLEETPNDPFLHYALGLEAINEGDEVALRQFEKVAEKYPDYLATYYQMAVLQLKLGKQAEAEISIEKGKKLAIEQREQKTLQELNALLMDWDEE